MECFIKFRQVWSKKFSSSTRFWTFLSQIGILSLDNQIDICVLNDSAKIQKAIQQLDQINFLNIAFVPIVHILPTDKSISFSADYHSRTTPKLLQFLQQIATPITIDKEVAVSLKIPELRTSVPALPHVRGFLSFLTPSMAADVKGAEQIFSLYQSSKVKIIFNETNYDLKIEKSADQVIFVVRPRADNIYHVTVPVSPPEFYKVFTSGVDLSASTVAFYVSLCCEQLNRKYFSDIGTTMQKRISIIRELTGEQSNLGTANAFQRLLQ